MPQEGSNKDFYRLTDNSSKQSYILMLADDSQKEKGTLKDWVKISEHLKNIEVRIPKIYNYFINENAVLMEDCSDKLLTNQLNTLNPSKDLQTIWEYYKTSTKMLTIAQKIENSKLKNSLDKNILYNDLLLFYDYHIKPRIIAQKNVFNPDLFYSEIKSLTVYLDSLNKSFTHRDYHSRNIILSNKELILIDFQDSCKGPRAYDLISLCFDPYVSLEAKTKEKIFFSNLELMTKELPRTIRKEVQESWKIVAIQRLYKVLGSYNFLGSQKGKEKFLNYIKPTLNILSEVDFFDKRWPYLTKTLKEGLIDFESSRK